MRLRLAIGCALAAVAFSATADAQQHGLARPNLVLEQLVEGMPREARQSVRVLTATFRPGDRTVPHTHRFPVTVYVLEGAFTLELKDRLPIIVKAGEAIVEPPNIEMTGYNRSASDPTKVVIVYVSTPDTPFLDPLH
jgi:quercetin dioxygenase-like cupin family protein